MRAIEISQPGAPEVLQLCERPRPQSGSGEVLIKVHAAGINRPDVLQRTGHYPVPAGASDLPRLEVVGEIVEGDLSGSGFKSGDMVCALVQGGTSGIGGVRRFRSRRRWAIIGCSPPPARARNVAPARPRALSAALIIVAKISSR